MLLSAVVIQSGFNDSSGINANGTPNSPFSLNSSLDGQGGSESGWAGAWDVTTGAATVKSVSGGGFEGDGAAAFFNNTAGASRALASPITSTALFEYRVMIPGPITADVLFRIEDSSQTPISSIAAQVNIGSDFQIYVVDGPASSVEGTGMFLTPGAFHTIGIEVNPTTSTFRVSLDGTFFNAPDPLNFRGTPTKIDQVHYLNEIASPDGSYLDFVRVTVSPYLSTPSPGTAGKNSTFTVTGATPGETVYFVYGLAAGSTAVPGNPGLVLGIANAKLAGSAVANSSGVASLTASVPAGAANKTIYFQTVAPSSQSLSNVVKYKFPALLTRGVSPAVTSGVSTLTVGPSNQTTHATTTSAVPTLQIDSQSNGASLQSIGKQKDEVKSTGAHAQPNNPKVYFADKKGGDKSAEIHALFASLGSKGSDDITLI